MYSTEFWRDMLSIQRSLLVHSGHKNRDW